jgi:hypothetical protein
MSQKMKPLFLVLCFCLSYSCNAIRPKYSSISEAIYATRADIAICYLTASNLGELGIVIDLATHKQIRVVLRRAESALNTAEIILNAPNADITKVQTQLDLAIKLTEQVESQLRAIMRSR